MISLLITVIIILFIYIKFYSLLLAIIYIPIFAFIMWIFFYKLNYSMTFLKNYIKFSRENYDISILISLISNGFGRIIFGLYFLSSYLSFIPFKQIYKYGTEIKKIKESGREPELGDINSNFYFYLLNIFLFVISAIFIAIFLTIITNILTCTIVGMYYNSDKKMKECLHSSLTSYFGAICFQPFYNIIVIIKDIGKIIVLINAILFILPIMKIITLIGDLFSYIIKSLYFYVKKERSSSQYYLNYLLKNIYFKCKILYEWSITIEYVNNK